MNSAASPRLVRIPNRATPLAAALVVRMNFRRVMLLIYVSLPRYDDLNAILRGSEPKSQPDSTELQVQLWLPKTLVANPNNAPATLIFGHLMHPASRLFVPSVTLMWPGSATSYGQA